MEEGGQGIRKWIRESERESEWEDELGPISSSYNNHWPSTHLRREGEREYREGAKDQQGG